MYALPAGPAPAPQRQTLVGMALAAMSMLMLTGEHPAGESWLPRGVVIPEVPANIILIAFAGVGVFAQWAVWSAKRNDRGHTTFALGVTVLVALLIINAQAYIYSQIGLGIGDGTYAVMFYAVTGMFMLLMVVGIIFSAVAAFRYAGGRSRDNEILAAHAIYWYTTAAVYAAVWFVVYVTK
jgi:heme/copper-type cytochrome/quinol oxidase subunit 3